MQMEILSLIQVTDVQPEDIAMSKDEVKLLIEHNEWDPIEAGEIVPGLEGHSLFADTFADEAPAADGEAPAADGAEAMGADEAPAADGEAPAADGAEAMGSR